MEIQKITNTVQEGQGTSSGLNSLLKAVRGKIFASDDKKAGSFEFMLISMLGLMLVAALGGFNERD